MFKKFLFIRKNYADKRISISLRSDMTLVAGQPKEHKDGSIGFELSLSDGKGEEKHFSTHHFASWPNAIVIKS
jgi:hypothetical protein